MFRLAIGFVIGYILGAKAGHERYEQIRRLTSTVSDNPAVQGVSGFVEAKVTNLLPGHQHEPRRPDAAYLVDDRRGHRQSPAVAAHGPVPSPMPHCS